MASITYWNRVEPRPRSGSVRAALAAQVRDPLWLLTRQWQVGEFHGEDAASPAYVRIEARFSLVAGWQAAGGEPQPYGGEAPLDALAEAEPLTPDLATAVEVGQRFETLLSREGAAALIPAFRAAYQVERPSEAALRALRDQGLARFLRVCAGRAVHGVDLVDAAAKALPGLPDRPEITDPSERQLVGDLLRELLDWVHVLFRGLSAEDAPSWQPERLRYSLTVSAPTPVGGTARLAAHPGLDGELDWYSFDLDAEVAPPDADEPPDDVSPDAEPPPVTALSRSVIPIDVRFRGMPNARWWEFEHGTTDFGDLDPDRRELAKLVIMDFMLVHGNDWLLVPFTQAVGSLARVDTLLVHDVFGGVTLVERADRPAPDEPLGGAWSMFSTSAPDGGLADFFVLAPSAGTAVAAGTALEEVRFLRDEMANMVWAIEQLSENGIGQPWPGHERSTARREGDGAAAPPPGVPLRYLVQTEAPEHWIPFVPVLADPERAEVALERAAMLRPVPGGPPEPVRPIGRVLRPTRLDDPRVYRVREEEVPRSGVRVLRSARRSRWTDGSTHLWVARQTRPGAGEGSSGLRFDVAVTAPPA